MKKTILTILAATAVSTGGLAGVITPYCRRRIRHDDSLLLRGLALIWRKNCGNR